MAHTSEQRDQLNRPLCNARKKDGTRCRAFAGQGVPGNPGIGPCKYHGGSTPNHKKHAVAVEAQQRMVKLGQPLEVTPHRALLGLLRAGSGHVAYLNSEVAKLDDLSQHEAEVLVRLYAEERDRLQRIASACIAAGVTELEVQLTISTTNAIVEPINAALASIGGLTDDQKRQFADALRIELAAAAESFGGASEPGAIYRPAPAA